MPLAALAALMACLDRREETEEAAGQVRHPRELAEEMEPPDLSMAAATAAAGHSAAQGRAGISTRLLEPMRKQTLAEVVAALDRLVRTAAAVAVRANMSKS